MIDAIVEYYLKNVQNILLSCSVNHLDIISQLDEFSLSRSEKFDISRIEGIQKARFRILTNYVLHFVPFWREMKFEYFPKKKNKKINVSDFPIISESDLIKYRVAFLSDALDSDFVEKILYQEKKSFNFLRDKRFFLRKKNLMKRKTRWNFEASIDNVEEERQSLNQFCSDIFGCIAQTCRTRNGLHINSESFFIEIIDENQKTMISGGTGSIVITDFDNLVMPLIRYEIGKTGFIDYSRCGCGRFLPRLFFAPQPQ